ncbi:MAG: hypothetical protein ACI8RD_006417 [Bacillariaceae sp.]|jgi:hypothetical protein
MMKKATFKAITLAGVLFNIASMITTVDAATCQPGTYTFTLNGSDCQVCPPSTYTDLPGSFYCKPCLDTMFQYEGANSAELWNGDLYCVYLGDDDDDIFNVDTMDPTTTYPPSSIQVAEGVFSDAPSQVPSPSPSRIPSTMPSKVSSTAPSSSPSNGPSSSPSSAPSDSSSSGPSNSPSSAPSDSPSSGPSNSPSSAPGDSPSSGPSNSPTTSPSSSPSASTPQPTETENDTTSVLELATEESIVCDEDGNFEWHGQCKQCPADYEAILYPFLVLFLLAFIVLLLQYLLPSCFTPLVWWGLEYLQMLYLIGISSISWSPLADIVFRKFLPLFALDLNASFNVQCVMGDNWQREADMLLVLSLPVIALILLTFLSKISSGRIIRDETVSRWMSVVLYMGYLKLILTSLEVLDFPTSWSADDLSSWVNSDPFYSTLGGLAGLLFYGVAFPSWFLQNLGRYYSLTHTDAQQQKDEPAGQDVENNGERSKRSSIKKQAKKKKDLFMTLGVFPTTLRPGAWWWPGLMMLRKFIFAMLLVVFDDASFLLLAIFLATHLLGFIAQQCYSPLGAESRKKWYHTATVDTVLQLCLIVMVGVAFLSFWSVNEDGMKENFQKWTEDILVLVIFTPSLIYLGVAIGVSCAQPEPRFKAAAFKILSYHTSAKGDNAPGDNGGGLSIMQSFDTQSASSQSYDEASDSQKEIQFLGDVDGADEWKQTADYDDWIATGAQSAVMQEDGGEEVSQGRGDSTIATNDLEIDIEGFDDDMATVYEEVWVDEATGEEISDPKNGNWMDAETGMRAVPIDN